MRREGDPGHGVLSARLRPLRPFPHELVALTFVAASIVGLERLPVTYPHTALLRVWGAPIAAVCSLALVIAVSAALMRRRHGLAGPDPGTEVPEIDTVAPTV